MQAGRTRRTLSAGFTLLEIIVVLGIMGLGAVLLVGGLRSLRNTNLRTEAGKLTAALRFSSDRAMATGSHHRLVIDLEKGTYRVEGCKGTIRLSKSREEVQQQDAAEVLKKFEEIKAKIDQSGIGDASAGSAAEVLEQASEKVGQAGCVPLKGRRGKTHQLRRNIRFERVRVSHLDDPVDKGVVTLNFFASGYAEKSVIQIANKDDDMYSLLVHPLGGRVQIVDGDYRRADKFIDEDALGNEIEE